MVEYIIYMAALGLVSVIALAGIIHPRFDDNLLQRTGLALTAFGGILRMITLHFGEDSEPLRYLFTYGTAVYALGTVLKFRKFNCKESTRNKPKGLT